MSSSVRNDSQLQIRAPDPCGVESDARLLQQFVKTRCDLAFAKLVERHGVPVMGVCRRVLADSQDAEDAFQATFMVLARKAKSLRTATSLSAWLYKTAFRIALRARANRIRRRERSFEAGIMMEDQLALQHIAADHEISVLEEELNRLPEKLRLPLFLCCVEGKTRDEAAEQLGWSPGSLKGRLERGRQLLRRRLTLRGISLSVAIALWLRTQETAPGSTHPVARCLNGCKPARSLRLAGQRWAMCPQNALNLTKGSFHIMTFGYAKTVACSIALIGLLSAANVCLTMPAAAGAGDDGVLVVSPTLANGDGLTFVALADDDQDKPKGDKPQERDKPRDGDKRDGDKPRDRDKPRDGDRPRDGDKPRDGDRRDGDKPRDGDRRTDDGRERERGRSASRRGA